MFLRRAPPIRHHRALAATGPHRRLIAALPGLSDEPVGAARRKTPPGAIRLHELAPDEHHAAALAGAAFRARSRRGGSVLSHVGVGATLLAFDG
jgi:hypothetical protein